MRRAVVVTVVASLASACSASDADDSNQEPTEVVVFAAASLTESFESMAQELEEEHPELRFTFSFGGSSSLAPQILSGAPANVFAAASPETMQQVVDGGAAVGEPELFVRNRLQIAVPPDNPAGVATLEDLADPALTVAMCAPEVPCGAAAERAFDVAGLEPKPDTLEEDVKAVLAKVELGEVDAGLVYRTDVVAAGSTVTGIDFTEAAEAINDYQIVTVTDSDGAQVFVDFVQSNRGREMLADAGFDLP
jgi:molybdate transport system substrate-binding protein